MTLEFLERGGYFDMPLQKAAGLLRVGVTTLKKVGLGCGGAAGAVGGVGNHVGGNLF